MSTLATRHGEGSRRYRRAPGPFWEADYRQSNLASPFWLESYQVATDRITIVPDATYGQVCKYEIRDGDDPLALGTERVVHLRPITKPNTGFPEWRAYEGDEVWTAWSSYLSSDWQIVDDPNYWCILISWRGDAGATAGAPFNIVTAAVNRSPNTKMLINIGNQRGSSEPLSAWTGPTVASLVGGWHDYMIHYKVAKDNTGFIELWLDGVAQTMFGGTTRWYGQTMYTDDTFLEFRQGIYRALTYSATNTHWVARPRIGWSREAVEA
jgi:hypothetical protein